MSLKSFPNVVDAREKKFYINFKNFNGDSLEEWVGTLEELKVKLYKEYPETLADAFYKAFEDAAKAMVLEDTRVNRDSVDIW